MSVGQLLAPKPELVRGEILDRGYADVPFELGNLACSELFADFDGIVAICEEPGGETIIDALKFSVNNLGNGDYHLVYRLPGQSNINETNNKGAGTDHKYIFHYGPHTIPHAQTKLGSVLPRQLSTFLEKCDEAYEAGRRSLKLGATALGLAEIMFTDDRMDDVHHLRLLDYVDSGNGLLGAAHIDRSLITAALWENLPGLRGVKAQNGILQPVTVEDVLAYAAKMRPIRHQEFMAKLFMGACFNRLPQAWRDIAGNPDLFAHDIVDASMFEDNNNPTLDNLTQDTKPKKRNAVVMFGNPHNKFTDFKVPRNPETGFGDIIKRIVTSKAA